VQKEYAVTDAPQIVDNAAEHLFEVRLGDDVAFAEYRLKPGQIVLPHTVVPDAFAGKGVASALAVHAFGYAREHGLKVIPTCPFMSAWVKKHPEAQDVVDPSCRAELGL
jgi:predicted GNAT family acetyltransferase